MGSQYSSLKNSFPIISFVLKQELGYGRLGYDGVQLHTMSFKGKDKLLHKNSSLISVPRDFKVSRGSLRSQETLLGSCVAPERLFTCATVGTGLDTCLQSCGGSSSNVIWCDMST